MKPVILVTGLGRCGTTMTMHMLAAAGVPCVGRAPGYEVSDVVDGPVHAGWLAAQAGRALKLLDPHRVRMPNGGPAVRVIWLDRSPQHQAISQAKFAVLIGGLARPARSQMRRWEASLPKERRQAWAALAAANASPNLRLRFEAILADPAAASAQIARLLAPDFGPLDVNAMAAVVKPRAPECAPDLRIEVELMEAAERAA